MSEKLNGYVEAAYENGPLSPRSLAAARGVSENLYSVLVHTELDNPPVDVVDLAQDLAGVYAEHGREMPLGWPPRMLDAEGSPSYSVALGHVATTLFVLPGNSISSKILTLPNVDLVIQSDDLWEYAEYFDKFGISEDDFGALAYVFAAKALFSRWGEQPDHMRGEYPIDDGGVDIEAMYEWDPRSAENMAYKRMLAYKFGEDGELPGDPLTKAAHLLSALLMGYSQTYYDSHNGLSGGVRIDMNKAMGEISSSWDWIWEGAQAHPGYNSWYVNRAAVRIGDGGLYPELL